MVARCATALLLVLLACATPTPRDPCDPVDPVLAATAFVVVVDPVAGQRVASPLAVRGCSRTFESNVVWELRSREGRVLASGHTTGGGVSGAGPFAFSADFRVDAPSLAHLTVFEPETSDGEGFPGGRAILPLVLLPRPE